MARNPKYQDTKVWQLAEEDRQAEALKTIRLRALRLTKEAADRDTADRGPPRGARSSVMAGAPPRLGQGNPSSAPRHSDPPLTKLAPLSPKGKGPDDPHPLRKGSGKRSFTEAEASGEVPL